MTAGRLSGDPHRRRHPLRRAAARGRVAARASSRPTTSAPTSASSAAPARASRCWSPRWSSASWPAGSGIAHPRPGRGRARRGDRPLRGRRGGPGPAQREHRAEPRRRLPARLVRLRLRVHARPRRRRPGHLARRAHRQRRPRAGATRTCWSGTASCGRSTTAPACTSTTRWSGGIGSADRFARQPYDASDHVLAALPARACPTPTPSSRRRSPASCSSDVRRPGAATTGSSRCPGASTTTTLRAAYVDFLLRAGRRRPGRGCRRRAPHERADGLPVRRPPVRAARGPRGVRQRRRGALLPAGRLPRGALPRRPRTRLAALAPERRRSTRWARRWPRSRRCAAATSRRARRVAPRWAPGSASSARPAAPSSSPGRSTAAPPTTPARQLEHLLDPWCARRPEPGLEDRAAGATSTAATPRA